MKKFLFILLFPFLLFAQVNYGDYGTIQETTIRIGGVTKYDYVYVHFKMYGDWELGTSWSGTSQECQSSGSGTLWIKPDTVGSTSTEMDSIYAEIYVCDEDGNAAYRPLVYADFDDAIPEFKETIQYLDYTDAITYSCCLGGLYSFHFGYAIKIGHVVSGTDDSLAITVKFSRN